MQTDVGIWLVLMRCLMLVIIAIRIGMFYDPSARFRLYVSGLAVLLCGGSLGWAFQSFLMLHHKPNVLAWQEFWPALVVFCVMVLVLRSRGNVAKLLPRVQWLYRN